MTDQSATVTQQDLFTDRYWTSRDGLCLHYRDYGGAQDAITARPVVLCLPGLTRNGRDFAHVAERICGDWRVICPDLRGRGDSAYAKDSATYNPLQYVDDLTALFEQAGISRFVAIGTSLGGILTMILASLDPRRIAAALLNDIGPELAQRGLERIRGYVGQGRTYSSWVHAAQAIQEAQAAAFPDYQIAEWLAMAKRCMVVGGNGRIVFDYDMKIAEPLALSGGDTGMELWTAFEALKECPVTSLRGELSDLFTASTQARMAALHPDLEAVIVPRVGHAPMLDEPQASAAIDRLLARAR